MSIFKTVLFLILVPGTIAGWVPYWLSRWDGGLPAVDFGNWRHVGWLFVVPGVAIVLWTSFAFAVKGQGTPAPFDPPKRFVATGLYRYMRNPMYIGVLLVICGQFFLHGNSNILAYLAAFWTVTHAKVVFWEEPALRKRHGDEYASYCEQVPRWLPNFSPTVRS